MTITLPDAIAFHYSTVRLFDAAGKEVPVKASSAPGGSVYIQLEHLPRGVYTVLLSGSRNHPTIRKRLVLA